MAISRSRLHLLRERLPRVSALVIGPGLRREPETQALVAEIVKLSPVPLVLDADALQRSSCGWARRRASSRRTRRRVRAHRGYGGAVGGVSRVESGDRGQRARHADRPRRDRLAAVRSRAGRCSRAAAAAICSPGSSAGCWRRRRAPMEKTLRAARAALGGVREGALARTRRRCAGACAGADERAAHGAARPSAGGAARGELSPVAQVVWRTLHAGGVELFRPCSVNTQRAARRSRHFLPL